MDWDAFQLLAYSAGIQPLSRWNTPYCEIFIGERDSADARGKDTLWAVSRGDLPVARLIYTPNFTNDGRVIDQDSRQMLALQDALSFVSDFVRAGGFNPRDAVCLEQLRPIPWSIDPVRGAVHGRPV